jgi:hypothetical protein
MASATYRLWSRYQSDNLSGTSIRFLHPVHGELEGHREVAGGQKLGRDGHHFDGIDLTGAELRRRCGDAS